MSRWQMNNIVERTSIRVDPKQVRADWELVKPHMNRMGVLNACLPPEGTDRFDYFYQEMPRLESYVEGTVFEKWIRMLPIKVARGTFLNLIPNQCLRAHRDPDNKWHLHINDEPGCYFFDFKESEAFPSKPDGYAYRYHTAGRFHSASNTSSFNRTHLVIAEYHCRDSFPAKLWSRTITLKMPLTMADSYPPKISHWDSIEQAFMVRWNARIIHEGYMFRGRAEDLDDGEFTYRTYTLEFIDPIKMIKSFDGEFDMIRLSLQTLGMDILLGEVIEKLC